MFSPGILLSAVVLPLLAQSPTGIDLGAIDRAAQPCNNFYQYACGTWMKNNPIPSDQARWGRFDELGERTRLTLRHILEQSPDEKTGEQYASCMDEKAIEAKGISPIRAELGRIDRLSGKEAFAEEIAHLHSTGVGALFRFTSGPDAKDATTVIAQLGQGGLTLPDRDYYIKTDAPSAGIRAKYLAHIRKLLELAGRNPREADAVLATETALAKASSDRVVLRDPQKRYNLKTIAQLSALAPEFDWNTYLHALQVRIEHLNVASPDFVAGMSAVLRSDLRPYLAWQVINAAAPALPAAFVQENFEFNGKTLSGTPVMPPRWKMCVQLVDRQMGEALGRKYVEQTFGKAGKERTLEMVAEIEAEMAKDIQSLAWMSDATRRQSLAKLRTVTNKIGYPDKWRDDSALKIVQGDLVGNSDRAAAFQFRREMDKIGKAPDKLEWSMTPPTVNAYYSPAMNNINFPAGILQPPFYFRDGDEAANYGAIGAVVGHELTHGFDDSGRQYDGEGNLRDWWTPEDARNFKDRANCIVAEYGNFVASGDVKLNGRLTLGENGADNGGVRLAYMALMESLAKHTLSDMHGYTPEQRFFLAYGQVWCQNIREEEARKRALTDPHSLGQYRVNGVLQNMPEFQKAFGCAAGQPMVSPNACRIW